MAIEWIDNNKPSFDCIIHAFEKDNFTIRPTRIVNDIRRDEVDINLGEGDDATYVTLSEEIVKTYVSWEDEDYYILEDSTTPQFYGITNMQGRCALATRTRVKSQEIALPRPGDPWEISLKISDVRVREGKFSLGVDYPYKDSNVCLRGRTYNSTQGNMNTNTSCKTFRLARTDSYYDKVIVNWKHFGQREFSVVNDDISSPYYGEECDLDLGGHIIGTAGGGWWVNYTTDIPPPQNGQLYTLTIPWTDGSTVKPALQGDVIPTLPDRDGKYIYDVCAPCGNAYADGTFWALGHYISDTEGVGTPTVPWKLNWDDPEEDPTYLSLGVFGKWWCGTVPAYLFKINNVELSNWFNTGVKPASGKIEFNCQSIFAWTLDPRGTHGPNPPYDNGEKVYGTLNSPNNQLEFQQSYHHLGGFNSSRIPSGFRPVSICETGGRSSDKRSLYMFMDDKFNRSANMQNSDLSINNEYGMDLPTGSDGTSVPPAYWRMYQHNHTFPLIFAIGKGNEFSSAGCSTPGTYWTRPDVVFVGPQANKHHPEYVWDPSVCHQRVEDRDINKRRLIFLNQAQSTDDNKVNGEKGRSATEQYEINHGTIGGTYDPETDCEEIKHYDVGLWANSYCNDHLNADSYYPAIGAVIAKKSGDFYNLDQNGMNKLYKHIDVGSDCRNYDAIRAYGYGTYQWHGLSHAMTKLENSKYDLNPGVGVDSASEFGTGQVVPWRVYADKHQGEVINLGTNVGFIGNLTWMHFVDGYDYVDEHSFTLPPEEGGEDIDLFQSQLGIMCWAEGWRILDAGTITSTKSRDAGEGTPSGTDDYEWTCTEEQQGYVERVNGPVLISHPARTFGYDYLGATATKKEPQMRYDGTHHTAEFLWQSIDAEGQPLPEPLPMQHQWKYSYDDHPLYHGNGTAGLDISEDIRTYMTAATLALLPSGCYSHHQIVNKDCASEMTWNCRGGAHTYEADWMKKYIPNTSGKKIKFHRQQGFSPRWTAFATQGQWCKQDSNDYGYAAAKIEDYHLSSLVFSEISNATAGYKQMVIPGKLTHAKPLLYTYVNYSEYAEDQLGNYATDDIWAPENYFMARSSIYHNIDWMNYSGGSWNPYLGIGVWHHPKRWDAKQLMPQNYLFWPKSMQDQLPSEWGLLNSGEPEFAGIGQSTKNHFYKINVPSIRYIYMHGTEKPADTYTQPTVDTVKWEVDMTNDFTDNTRIDPGHCYGLIIMNDAPYQLEDQRWMEHFYVKSNGAGANFSFLPQPHDSIDNDVEEAKFNEAIGFGNLKFTTGTTWEVTFSKQWINDRHGGYNDSLPNYLKVCFYKARIQFGDQHLGFLIADSVWYDQQNLEQSAFTPDFHYGNSLVKRGTAVATSVESQGWTREPLKYSVKSVINYATRARSEQLGANITGATTVHLFGEIDLFNLWPSNNLYLNTYYDINYAHSNNTYYTNVAKTTYSDVSIDEYNSSLGNAGIPDYIEAVVAESGERLTSDSGELLWQ